MSSANRRRRTPAWDDLEDRLCPAPFVGPTPYVPASTVPTQRTDPTSIALENIYARQAATWSPQVVFLGDSYTYNFAYAAGSGVWGQSIAGLDAADFGESGDATQNILWRVENGEFPAHPKVVVLQAGANNLGTDGESPEDTLAGIENLVGVIHSLSPTSKILVVGMLPVGDPTNVFRPEIVQINAQLARFVDNRTSFFLDVGRSLLAPDGTLTAVSDDPDLVHINALGYQDWAAHMIGPLRLLLDLDPMPTALLPLPMNFTPFDVSDPDLSIAETTGLYESILGREPDAAGLVTDVNYLENGGSPSVLASVFLHSAAYESDLVASFYQTFAGRAGSSAEVAAWVNLMQRGSSAEQVADLMMTSDGFNALHPDNASFLQALFTDTIGRPPGAAELSAWENYMAGGVGRAAMVSGFIRSPGAAQDAVAGFAALFWASPIDPYTEAGDVQFLLSGGSLADLAAAFASSPTFIARAGASVG